VVVPLATTSWGDGERTALLIHGLSSSAAGWWRLGPDVASLGFTVTAPDLRGHGGSDDGDGFHGDGYRDDVLALGTGWDLVLGHSLGGFVAMACQLADPTFARALVLEDPAIGMPVTEAGRAGLMADYDPPLTIEAMAATRPRWHPRDIEAKLAALHSAGRHVVAGTAALFQDDLWARTHEIAVPLLVIGADLDSTVTRDGRQAAERFGRFVTIPGSSHSIHRDSYDAFWSVLAGWIDQLGGARATV
jgi:pimeloyl-ACP methyl ester carboxylesterase